MGKNEKGFQKVFGGGGVGVSKRKMLGGVFFGAGKKKGVGKVKERETHLQKGEKEKTCWGGGPLTLYGGERWGLTMGGGV